MGNNNTPKETRNKTFCERIKAEFRNQTVLDWVKALGSYVVVVGIIVGIATFYHEKDKEAAARYLNIIRDLGNDSNSVRAGAVITMETYLKKRDKINEKYREQGIYVLTTHLAVEPTPLVRSTTQEVLVNIGEMDNDNIVVRKLVCSNRHLWEQSGLTPESLISGGTVRPNLQSIANTLIQIFQLKKRIYSQAPEPLDLSNIYLMSDNYSLEDVNLFNVQLDGACLVRMNFQKCTMEECKLRGAHLNNAILTEAKLTSVDLQEANLTGAEFEGATLNDVSLFFADLSGANMKRADLTGAFLKMVKLINAKLSGAILQDANLEGANLEGADLRALLLFDLDSKKFQSDLDEGTISKDLRQEFEDNQISLSKNTTVSVEEKDRRWLITDKDNEQTYTVRKEERLNICTEAMIVPTEQFSIDSNDTKKFQSDLDKCTISKVLREEFENKRIDLSQYTTASIGEKDGTWIISDTQNKQTYTVRKKNGQLKIYKKTKLDPTELFSVDSKKFKKDLDDVTISEDLRQEFKNNWIDLSENTAISVEEKGSIWLINDKDNEPTYTIRKEEWLNVCKETKFDLVDIKKAENWDKAFYDDDIWEKLSSQKD